MTAETSQGVDLTTLPELTNHFDVFFVDQFGVLHDGFTQFDGSADALRRLKAAGKTVVLIGNSGKRSAANQQRLSKLGIGEDCYDHFVSSGEVGWNLLHAMQQQSSGGKRQRCFFISRDDDTSAIDGLDFDLVDDSGRADVVLLSGCRDDIDSIDYYNKMLAPAAARQTPCICTSPDKMVLTQAGLKFGPGQIAQHYESLGAPVRWIGKPHAQIYQHALGFLGGAGASRIICVGDSLEHDIAGGRSAGLQTALVRTGILADLDAAGLEQNYQRYGVRPDFLLSQFKWEESK